MPLLFLEMNTAFDNIKPPISIKTARLTITDITPDDKQTYFRLYTDEELNEWWGYDYRKDLGENTPTPEYFYSFMQELKAKKEEYSFAVRLNNEMIGELVLYNFTPDYSAEIGFRLFKDYHGKGYAYESANALKEYAMNSLGVKCLKSRCFKVNAPSKRLIEKLGLTQIDQNQTHYFFELQDK